VTPGLEARSMGSKNSSAAHLSSGLVRRRLGTEESPGDSRKPAISVDEQIGTPQTGARSGARSGARVNSRVHAPDHAGGHPLKAGAVLQTEQEQTAG
jgi:hypothetical protein